MLFYTCFKREVFEFAVEGDNLTSSLKPGFHLIAPVATIAAVVKKRVSATVAVYGITPFNDGSDGNDNRRWDRILRTLQPASH